MAIRTRVPRFAVRRGSVLCSSFHGTVRMGARPPPSRRPPSSSGAWPLRWPRRCSLAGLWHENRNNDKSRAACLKSGQFGFQTRAKFLLVAFTAAQRRAELPLTRSGGPQAPTDGVAPSPRRDAGPSAHGGSSVHPRWAVTPSQCQCSRREVTRPPRRGATRPPCLPPSPHQCIARLAVTPPQRQCPRRGVTQLPCPLPSPRQCSTRRPFPHPSHCPRWGAGSRTTRTGRLGRLATSRHQRRRPPPPPRPPVRRA